MSSSQNRTYNVLYHTGQPADIKVYHFPTPEMAKDWSESVGIVKEHIGEINDKCEREGRWDRRTHDDYRPWIVRCQVFIRKFGKEAVPSDIQGTLNDVEEAFGLPRTDFTDV